MHLRKIHIIFTEQFRDKPTELKKSEKMKAQLIYNRSRRELLSCEIGEKYGCKAILSSKEINIYDLCEKQVIENYIKGFKIISEERKWGVQQFFIFTDGFRIPAGHVDCTGKGGVNFSEDESCPFDAGRDHAQSINYLRGSLTDCDHISLLAHITGMDIKIE